MVKSRIQGASKVPGVVPKYNWTYPAYVPILPHSVPLHVVSYYMLTLLFTLLDSLVTIFREEGPAALYKGFVPKVLRLAPGGGVLLLVVEFTLNVFRQGALSSLLTIHSCGDNAPHTLDYSQPWAHHTSKPASGSSVAATNTTRTPR